MYTEWQRFAREYGHTLSGKGLLDNTNIPCTLSGKDLLDNTDIRYTEWQRFAREYGHTMYT